MGEMRSPYMVGITFGKRSFSDRIQYSLHISWISLNTFLYCFDYHQITPFIKRILYKKFSFTVRICSFNLTSYGFGQIY